MIRELSRWGIGPSIAMAAVGYAAIAGAATRIWPEVCLIRIVPSSVFLTAGAVLILVGVPMLAAAGRAATVAYNSDKLATTGIFGVVRNPIYAAWIVFIIPGIVLWTRSWPLLLTPLMAYAVFKMRIRRENEYLEKRFGEAFRQYKANVNELFPLPRRRGR